MSIWLPSPNESQPSNPLGDIHIHVKQALKNHKLVMKVFNLTQNPPHLRHLNLVQS
jgi:hypothetical protein